MLATKLTLEASDLSFKIRPSFQDVDFQIATLSARLQTFHNYTVETIEDNYSFLEYKRY